MNPFPDPATLSKRASKVTLAMLLMVAVSGYFMGLNQTRGTHDPTAGVDSDTRSLSTREGNSTPTVTGSAVPRIVAYSQLGEASLRPNANWHSTLATLAPRPAQTVAPKSPKEAALERARAVEMRRSRRAFDGAPPVIPHPIDPTSPASCRACHETGLAVRDVVAPRMSHGELGLCTQCHVPSGGSGPPSASPLPAWFADNAFHGVVSSGAGSRAWPGAPPTIPHSLQLRENCSSCHGVNGLPGLRTSHPERPLCLQCHVPESAGSALPWAQPVRSNPAADFSLLR
ncbi:MAG: hypothetical protein IT580_20085 [Verrucomicrobiales bacterium]|nr:hypothetical protein [Verrucomicrobiales bacterium]